MLIKSWLAWAHKQLAASGVVADFQAAHFEAELMLSEILGVNRSYLRAHDDQPLSATALALATRYLNARSASYPMAYILGYREFYGRRFSVNSSTLIPRPDTETLIDWCLENFASDQSLSVLDLGTGSGAIGISLACERPPWQISASDISAAALSTAAQNASALNAHVRFYQGSWFAALQQPYKDPFKEAKSAKNQRFDLIISNPPYVESEHHLLQEGDVRFEPLTALISGDDGLDDIALIVEKASEHLRPNGWLIIEHGYEQAAAVRAIYQKAGFAEIQTHCDLANNPRFTCGQHSE